MKFGIKKVEKNGKEVYEWNLYPRKTEKIEDELYFPLSRPRELFNKQIRISKGDEIFGALRIPNMNDENTLDQLSRNFLNMLTKLVDKEMPLKLGNPYYVNYDKYQQKITLKKKRKVIDDDDSYIDFEFIKYAKFIDEKEAKEKTLYIFLREDDPAILFVDKK